MLRKESLIAVVLLSTALATANKAFAENWITTDRIINQREVRIQIDKDSIRRDGGNWITFMQRLQTDSNPPFKPFKGEVNCIKTHLALYLQRTEGRINSAVTENGSLILHTKTTQAMS